MEIRKARDNVIRVDAYAVFDSHGFAYQTRRLDDLLGMTYTEMISAKGLVYGSEKTEDLLNTTDDEKIKCVDCGNENIAALVL